MQRTIDLLPLCLRADVGSFNRETRTVDLIFSTGAPVERYDWMSGKKYLEKLSITAGAIRLERLNAGAPLLDSHSSWSIADQIGAVVPGSARVEGKRAIATVRFSRREQVLPILQDVEDGILRSVSVGYRVHRFEEDASSGSKVPIRTAVDWEPFEISMVTMPADVGATVRANDGSRRVDPTLANACVVVTRVDATADADRNRRLRLALAQQ